jgi:hypothetical protein
MAVFNQSATSLGANLKQEVSVSQRFLKFLGLPKTSNAGEEVAFGELGMRSGTDLGKRIVSFKYVAKAQDEISLEKVRSEFGTHTMSSQQNANYFWGFTNAGRCFGGYQVRVTVLWQNC